MTINGEDMRAACNNTGGPTGACGVLCEETSDKPAGSAWDVGEDDAWRCGVGTGGEWCWGWKAKTGVGWGGMHERVERGVEIGEQMAKERWEIENKEEQ